MACFPSVLKWSSVYEKKIQLAAGVTTVVFVVTDSVPRAREPPDLICAAVIFG